MGLNLSIDHYIDSNSEGSKNVMLVSYEKDAFKSISFLDFIVNPLYFSNNPIFLIEPCFGKSSKVVPSNIKDISFLDTMRFINQTYRIINFKLKRHSLWFFVSNKISSSQSDDAKKAIRSLQLDWYKSTASIDPYTIFNDISHITNIEDVFKMVSPSTMRASSPLRTGAQICGKIIPRRSHNALKITVPQTFQTNIADIEQETIDDMNLIIPGIYIGNERAASSRDLLDNHFITHIINLSSYTTKNFFPDRYQYFSVEINDTDFQELTQEFWSALTFLKKSVQSGGNVLVHCRKGISRSAALIASYLSDETAMPIDSAISFIKTRRPIININPGFIEQLKSREESRVRSKPKLLLTQI